MQSDVTVNGYHLPTLARLCKELHSPAQGALAEFIWRLHNSRELPVELAREFMHSAGYVPFKGYPLTRQHQA
jgi:hypothetical protein